MKTLLQIAQEYIRSRDYARDPHVTLEKMMNDAVAQSQKTHARLEQDPALKELCLYYAGALSAVLNTIPEPKRVHALTQALSGLVIDWEDIHNEYNAQLRPPESSPQPQH